MISEPLRHSFAVAAVIVKSILLPFSAIDELKQNEMV
jgi:hypothetical protein